MAIQHELSSDIAVALLTGKEKDRKQLNDLKEVVFRVHNALQRLTAADSQSQRKRAHAAGQTKDK
jgi:hypothetical protein